jgi:hypothetical protein
MKEDKEKKGSKGGKKPYRFTLDERRYKDVIAILDSIPKPFRPEYIAEAIRVARRHFGLRGEPNGPHSFKGSFDFKEGNVL